MIYIDENNNLKDEDFNRIFNLNENLVFKFQDNSLVIRTDGCFLFFEDIEERNKDIFEAYDFFKLKTYFNDFNDFINFSKSIELKLGYELYVSDFLNNSDISIRTLELEFIKTGSISGEEI